MKSTSCLGIIGHKERWRLDFMITESQVVMKIVKVTEKVPRIPAQNFEDSERGEEYGLN